MSFDNDKGCHIVLQWLQQEVEFFKKDNNTHTTIVDKSNGSTHADNWQTWDSKDQVDKSGKQLGKS